jgi:hypothetical protein
MFQAFRSDPGGQNLIRRIGFLPEAEPVIGPRV